ASREIGPERLAIPNGRYTERKPRTKHSWRTATALSGRRIKPRPAGSVGRHILGQRDAFEPGANIVRRRKTTGSAGDLPADRNADAAELRHDGDCRLVGGVVADEDRPTASEGRVPHQLPHTRSLVETDRLDLEDEFAGKNLDRLGRDLFAGGAHGVAD